MPLEGITRFCFGASYAVALLLEVIQLIRPRPPQRMAAIVFGSAGLLAHTLFLAVQQPYLGSQFGSLLFLAWILAVFYVYGSVHHRQVAWGVFVLPVVLGLVVLTAAYPPAANLNDQETTPLRENVLRGLLVSFWGLLHVGLLLLAAVGICVGFVASIMYLVQVRRLRSKLPPGKHERLLSLERLERMNRRAILLAFPLLTGGALIGVALMLQRAEQIQGWTDPRILGTAALWVVFTLLLYLRYAGRLGGRRLAQLTIVAFLLMIFTLAFAHSLTSGGVP